MIDLIIKRMDFRFPSGQASRTKLASDGSNYTYGAGNELLGFDFAGMKELLTKSLTDVDDAEPAKATHKHSLCPYAVHSAHVALIKACDDAQTTWSVLRQRFSRDIGASSMISLYSKQSDTPVTKTAMTYQDGDDLPRQ
jgi:hypothetical protein